jgi:hypothetical protein
MGQHWMGQHRSITIRWVSTRSITIRWVAIQWVIMLGWGTRHRGAAEYSRVLSGYRVVTVPSARCLSLSVENSAVTVPQVVQVGNRAECSVRDV